MIILAHSGSISPSWVGMVVKFPDSGVLHKSDIFLILRSLFNVAGEGGPLLVVKLLFVVEVFGEILPK